MNEVYFLKNENLQSNKKKKNGDNSNSESQSNEESKKKLLSLKNKEDDNIVNKINHYFENLDNESNDANEELQFEKDIENHEGNIMKDKNKLIKDYDDLKSQNTKKQSLMHKDLLDIKNTEEHYTVNDDDLRFKNNEIQPSENIKFNDLNVDNLLNNSRKELLKFIKLASTEINYILNIYKQYLFQYIDNGSQIMSNEFKCKIFKNNSEECKIAESYLIDTTKKVQNNINDIIEKSSVEIINVLLN
ncbi:hypothetical protein NAPIS_ORF01226 [Vairimorpha apis BRL 01]|uniref:Uncharacterized protein n=1 Tax=Vairimorpha apis BRL 01 TaxID=1037528 RepID=T0MJU3_9MICR|nr:hypothetical protein NAPIS_ORF01226 [Vairimorpha apis BRL 01]